MSGRHRGQESGGQAEQGRAAADDHDHTQTAEPGEGGGAAAIEAVSRRDFRLLVDTMHYGRAGARAADIAALNPHQIGYVQISDVKLVPDDPEYFQEPIGERLVPGTGELDNLEMLAGSRPGSASASRCQCGRPPATVGRTSAWEHA